jgi:hypothetical protein
LDYKNPLEQFIDCLSEVRQFLYSSIATSTVHHHQLRIITNFGGPVNLVIRTPSKEGSLALLRELRMWYLPQLRYITEGGVHGVGWIC